MATFNSTQGAAGSGLGDSRVAALQAQVQALQARILELESRGDADNVAVGAAQLVGPVRFGAAEGEHWGGQTIPGVVRFHEGATYKVDLYDDGFGHASTRSVSVSPLCVSFGGVVPNGTAVLVHVVPGDLIEVAEREGGS